MKKVSKQVKKFSYKPLKSLKYGKDGLIKKTRRGRKNEKIGDIPLYHTIQIGAGYNIKSGKHTQVNMYISDELMKASEEDRMRRMAKTKKLADFIDVKNGE